MTRQRYLAEILRLYRQALDTPSRSTRRDLAIASALYADGVPLHSFAHAIRLATLRRRLGKHHARIQSLAYYRAVLDRLSDEELEPAYVDYVKRRYQWDSMPEKTRLQRQHPAL